jgi:hypothetical protein
MCVLTIKKDENLLPLRTKSRIMALSNLEKPIWSNREFALHLFFVRIPFVSLLASLLKNAVRCDKAIAKTRSAMVFSRPTKQ